ncbi:hypothetical protein J6590_020891 [Homalodisca vitripennis]|nr:hypothetical protein J6590_020891 [Homalodisca vitripennis]
MSSVTCGLTGPEYVRDAHLYLAGQVICGYTDIRIQVSVNGPLHLTSYRERIREDMTLQHFRVTDLELCNNVLVRHSTSRVTSYAEVL